MSAAPCFFATPAQLRAWLAARHETEQELLVRLYKKGVGEPSVTWPELVDELLCVGWIDGVRRGIDDRSYSIRITPRKARSTWSAVNVRRFAELEAEGRVLPAGRAAFARRDEARTAIYAYEREEATFDEDHETRFRAHAEAWAFFSAVAPSYRRVATHWVVSAKRPETRERRLVQLIADSAAGRRLRHLTPRGERDR
ncbi:MAG: YdeI/OmpD-associated family protein [Solirubrobacteraceae bacterium]